MKLTLKEFKAKVEKLSMRKGYGNTCLSNSLFPSPIIEYEFKFMINIINL